MNRVALSLLTLPAILWVAVASGAWLLGKVRPGMSLQETVMLGSYFALFTYVAMGLIAVPLLLLCLWRRWTTVWHAMAVGAITGAVPLSLRAFSQLFDERLHLHYRLQQLASAATSEFVVMGLVGGASFWLLAIWRNPSIGRSRARQQSQVFESAA